MHVFGMPFLQADLPGAGPFSHHAWQWCVCVCMGRSMIEAVSFKNPEVQLQVYLISVCWYSSRLLSNADNKRPHHMGWACCPPHTLFTVPHRLSNTFTHKCMHLYFLFCTTLVPQGLCFPSSLFISIFASPQSPGVLQKWLIVYFDEKFVTFLSIPKNQWRTWIFYPADSIVHLLR